MRRVADDRQERPAVLVRRPYIDRRGIAPTASYVNRVDQYRALINLFDRGLLSPQEFQEQGKRVSDG
jgi:hypothetical protein